MRLKMTFDGTVTDGKLQLDDPDLFHRFCKSLEGKRIRLTIEPSFNLRSNAQNRWLWGVAYRLLAEHTGHDEWEIHEFCKLKFLPKIIELKGNNGDHITQIVGGSTAKLSTIEFNEYKEKIQKLAAELGCIIPDPEP